MSRYERPNVTASDVDATDDLTVADDASLGDDLTLAAGSVLTWATDTNLYRGAANVLKTDDALTVVGTLLVTGTVGFNGSAAVAKPAVTGAQDDGTALASLLTALATLGLVTDSSTAT